MTSMVLLTVWARTAIHSNCG